MARSMSSRSSGWRDSAPSSRGCTLAGPLPASRFDEVPPRRQASARGRARRRRRDRPAVGRAAREGGRTRPTRTSVRSVPLPGSRSAGCVHRCRSRQRTAARQHSAPDRFPRWSWSWLDTAPRRLARGPESPGSSRGRRSLRRGDLDDIAGVCPEPVLEWEEGHRSNLPRRRGWPPPPRGAAGRDGQTYGGRGCQRPRSSAVTRWRLLVERRRAGRFAKGSEPAEEIRRRRRPRPAILLQESRHDVVEGLGHLSRSVLSGTGHG